jgi:hypothetical protein
MAYNIKQSSSLFTLFNGPYRLRYDFNKYETMIIFTSKAGFALLLAYTKVLIKGNFNLNIYTRRVVLYWQIEKKNNKPLSLIALEILTLISITL